MSIALKSLEYPLDKVHYLLRAFAREIFGKADKKLTEKIKFFQVIDKEEVSTNIYARLAEKEYELIGIDRAPELAGRLEALTGKRFLARSPKVYSPIDDATSMDFAKIVKREVKKVASTIKRQGRKDMRVLVIGTGTGVDPETAFYQAKVINGIEDVYIDAIDVQPEAIRNTRFNIRLAGKAYEDAIHPKLVKEYREFQNLTDDYDLIIFNAPDAVKFKHGQRSSVGHMNMHLFLDIVERAIRHLRPGGTMLLDNTYEALCRVRRSIPGYMKHDFVQGDEKWFSSEHGVTLRISCPLKTASGRYASVEIAGPQSIGVSDVRGQMSEVRELENRRDKVPKIVIEDPTENDAEEISRLSVFADNKGDSSLGARELSTIVERMKQNDEKVYLRVYRIDDKVAGYLYATGYPYVVYDDDESLDRSGEKKLHIRHIVVDESYRQRGIARVLFRDVFKWAKLQGYEKITLGTAHPAIIKIIKPFGFEYKDGSYVWEKPTFNKRKMEDVVARLVNALIIVSERKEKVVLALDTDLGKGEINRLLNELIKVIPTLENNNEELKRFLGNLTIIKGTGEELSKRLTNITGENGRVYKENIIIIGKYINIEKGLFDSFKDLATITGIDDSEFPETGYLPLIEIMLFTVGKYLGWSKDTLFKNYSTIPNVSSVDELSEEDYRALFEKDGKTILIRLIPNAIRYAPEEFRNMMAGTAEILKRA